MKLQFKTLLNHRTAMLLFGRSDNGYTIISFNESLLNIEITDNCDRMQVINFLGKGIDFDFI